MLVYFLFQLDHYPYAEDQNTAEKSELVIV